MMEKKGIALSICGTSGTDPVNSPWKATFLTD